MIIKALIVVLKTFCSLKNFKLKTDEKLKFIKTFKTGNLTNQITTKPENDYTNTNINF